MEYENLLSELKRLGRSREHIVKLTDSSKQERDFSYYLPILC